VASVPPTWGREPRVHFLRGGGWEGGYGREKEQISGVESFHSRKLRGKKSSWFSRRVTALREKRGIRRGRKKLLQSLAGTASWRGWNGVKRLYKIRLAPTSPKNQNKKNGEAGAIGLGDLMHRKA